MLYATILMDLLGAKAEEVKRSLTRAENEANALCVQAQATEARA